MEDRGFDLDAAGLRAGSADMATGIEVLAAKLEDALPAETAVRRRSRGFLSREKVVEEIEVCTARLIANPVAHKLKAQAIDALVERIRSGS